MCAPASQILSCKCDLVMLQRVAGRVFVVLCRGLNVSMLPVSGELLVCLSYLAGLGVSVSHCVPHWGVFVSNERLELQKRDYCYMGCVLCSVIAVLRKSFVCCCSSFNLFTTV